MNLKWIVGYIDCYGKVHHKAVRESDPNDSHNKLWPSIHHNKWRWMPSIPNQLNTYGEELDGDSVDHIWFVVDIYNR